MKKRILALLLAMALMIGLMPVLRTEAQAAGLSLAEVQSKFPTGAYWNHYVSNYSETGDSLVNNWNESFANNITWTPCVSHNMSNTVGHYDCNFFDGGIQCCGFARKVAYDIYGSRASGWGLSSTVKPGDVVWFSSWETDPTYGHWVFVYAVSGSYITVGEASVEGRLCQIRWGHTYNMNEFYSYKIHSAPYALNVSVESVDLGDDFYARIKNPVRNMYVTNDRDNVSLRSAQEGVSQIWFFDHLSDGSYLIRSPLNGKVMDVADASAADGANVQTFSQNKSNAQKWRITGKAGAYQLSALCTGGVMDVTNAGWAEGTNIQMVTRNGNDAQNFDIEILEELSPLPQVTSDKQLYAPGEQVTISWPYVYCTDRFWIDIWSADMTQHPVSENMLNGTSYTFTPPAVGDYTVFVTGTMVDTEYLSLPYTFTVGHVHSYTATVTEATCTEVGYTTYTCECGEGYIADHVDPLGHDMGPWETFTEATCIAPGTERAVCARCGHTETRVIGEGYGEWIEHKPEDVDDALIETKTQYRYRDLETITSDQPGLEGWELTDSEWIASGSGTVTYVPAWPSGFYTSHSLFSQYNNQGKFSTETETEKVTVDSDSVSGYIYWHWCRGTYANGPISRLINSEYTSEFCAFHAFYSTTDPAILEKADGGGHAYTNASCCTDSYWWFCLPVNTQSYTTYSKLFTYQRWNDWSDWSDDAYNATDSRQVESRTLYRVMNAEAGPHSWNSGIVTTPASCTQDGVKTYTCALCGETRTEIIPMTGHNYVNGTCTGCGDSLITVIAEGWSGATQWTLTSDGVLTVYGKGNMKNYGWAGGQPWAKYAAQITSVVIEEGVAQIGSGAFKDMTALESVTLPKSGLTKIGIAAFYGCTSLKEITIPEGIYTIWEYTFKNCSALESVNLPKTLIKIDQGGFEACTALRSLYLPTNVEIIGGWSFKGCTSLASVDMEWADATEIRAGAFKNCTALTEIVLPKQIATLGDSCFYGIGAERFVVPATVTKIVDWCFARSSVKEIVFEGDAPAIGEGAFNKITLTAYYDGGNDTWTAAVRQNYGGSVIWKAQ